MNVLINVRIINIGKYNEEPHRVFTVGSKVRVAYNYLVVNSFSNLMVASMCVTFNLKHAPDSINKKNDNIDSCDEILSDDNGKILIKSNYYIY